MKKITKILSSVALVIMLGVTLTACGGAKVLWSADLTKGNNNLFGIYGTVQDNKNSITLKRAEGQNYAGSTYFGETDKNFDWNKGGLNVELTVNLKTTDFDNGDYSVWSLALNETDGKYITETPVFFVGTANGVKFVYKNVGVDTDYAALASDKDAVSVESGKYTIVFDYSVEDNDNVELKIQLKDAKNKQVYESDDIAITAIDHAGYTGGQALKEENIKGLRYLWLARTTVDTEVTGLKITE